MIRNRTNMYKTTLSVVMVAAVLTAAGCGSESSQSSTDPRVQPVVTAVIEAYGGEKALRSVRGYRMKGIQRAIQKGVTIRAERWFARPDRLHLELEYPDHHETRLTKGTEGWVGPSADALEPAHAVRLQAMRLQTARLDLPLRLLERLSDVQWRGSDDLGRQVLRLPLDDELYIDYQIDPGTHRIVKVTMWMPGPPAMEFAAEYGLFHMIDGVLVAFHEVTYAGASATSEFQTTEFEWSPSEQESKTKSGQKSEI
jgi:hypothetical protein